MMNLKLTNVEAVALGSILDDLINNYPEIINYNAPLITGTEPVHRIRVILDKVEGARMAAH